MPIGLIIFIAYLAGIFVYGCLHFAIAETFPKQTLVSTQWELLLGAASIWPLIILTWIFRLVLVSGKAVVDRHERKKQFKAVPNLPEYPGKAK